MEYLLCAVIGYAFGCINFAFIISKLKGFDIRDTGSGNAGASNVKMALGWKYGVLTALCDILKAFLATVLAEKLFPNVSLAPVLSGAFAVLGHIFPFYMNFKGGKGYASYTGMLIALNWKLALAMIAYGIVCTLVTDYIFIATVSTTFIVFIYYCIQKAEAGFLFLLALLAAVITYKHKINFIRLKNHEEVGLRDSGKHRVK